MTEPNEGCPDCGTTERVHDIECAQPYLPELLLLAHSLRDLNSNQASEYGHRFLEVSIGEQGETLTVHATSFRGAFREEPPFWNIFLEDRKGHQGAFRRQPLELVPTSLVRERVRALAGAYQWMKDRA